MFSANFSPLQEIISLNSVGLERSHYVSILSLFLFDIASERFFFKREAGRNRLFDIFIRLRAL